MTNFHVERYNEIRAGDTLYCILQFFPNEWKCALLVRMKLISSERVNLRKECLSRNYEFPVCKLCIFLMYVTCDSKIISCRCFMFTPKKSNFEETKITINAVFKHRYQNFWFLRNFLIIFL